MNTNQANEVKQAVESVNGNGFLGSLAWWGQWMVKVRRADLEALADRANLLTSYLPDAPSAEKAFSRAATAAEDGKAGILVEQIERGKDEITYGVLHRSTDLAAKETGYRQVAKVTYFPLLGRVMSDRPNNPTVKAIIDSLPIYSEFLISEDIRGMIARVMKAASAVSMTASMGVGHGMNSRFVPEAGTELLEALVNTLNGIKGADMMVIRVPDEPISRGSMQKAAQSDLAKGVAAAEEKLEELRLAIQAAQAEEEAEPSNVHRGPREKTIEKRIAEYEDLAGMIDLYADVLRFKADDLKGRLEAVNGGLKELLGLV